MSENTRLDIDSNIPQEMDKIGRAADAAARKINNLGSGSALEELQRMMKSVEREFKNFGGSADNAFDKALKNLSKSSMPDSVRDVYRNALILAKEGRMELEAEYHKLGTASDEAARQVMAAEAKLAKAVRNKKSQQPARAELSTALAAQQEVEGQFALARMNAEKLKMFHLQLRDALNKEYNEFYLKRQATQKTANLQELQSFKDLGVKLIGEDAVLYKRLTESAKAAANLEKDQYQKKLESMASAQKEADTRFEAMRKDSLSRGKSLILQAAKDDAAALAAADKTAAAAELARYRQKLESMASAQKEADTRFEAMRKDSLNRGKSLILQAAKDDAAALAAADKTAAAAELARYRQKLESMASAQKEADTRFEAMRKDSLNRGKSLILQAARDELSAQAAFSKAASEAAAKNQEFINRYKNATKDLLTENKRRAESLLQYLTVVKAVAEKSKEYATAKYGTAAVAMATGSEFDVLNRSLTTTESKMPPLLQGFKALGGRLIDVHSATRGLASGFNLLWLTWGQMGPLFAGAAISMGTKSIVSMGAQIGHQLEIVRVLSEESDDSVKGLNDQLMNISRTGPYGPLKVAEALKTLSLAGLDANQVTQALPRVLQFAAAGTTSIEKAAEVMTGVATAFGYTAENFNLVGDIVTKTAAVSKAGIEDMGEAFKAASVVSTQFGVSIKDVSLLLALQANLNIKNSAAGTNVRNMYTDLSGRSKESRKLMKAMNLELTDSQGRFKDVVTIVKELDGALSKFSGKSARAAQLASISERGGKPIVAAFSAYNTEVREFAVVNGQMVETVTNQLEQLKKKTEDNYGFMALAAAKLSMTPLKQMESVVATFQTSLAQAFMGMEDEVLVTSARLKEVFNSPEFTSALKNLITGVASFTEALLENLDVVGKVILGYVGFKVLATTASMFLSLHSAVQAATTSLVAYRTAQAAAAGADTAAGIAASGAAAAAGRVGGNLLKAIPIVGTIISVGTAAWSMWELYNLTQGKTADVTKAAADGIKNSGMIEALDSENERLLKQVAILDLSLKLKRQVTEQEFNSMQKAEEAAANEAKRVGQVVARARELEKEEAAFRQAEANLTAALFKSMGAEAKNSPAVVQLRKRAEEVAKARSLLNTEPIKTELEYKVARNSSTTKVVSDMTDQLAKVLRDQKIPGTKIFDPDAVDQSTKSVVSSTEKQISAVVKGGNAQLNEAKSNYDLLRDLTEARHKAGVISEGEYQVELIKQTSVGEAAQIKAITDTEAKLKPLYAEALSKYKEGSAEYLALDEKRVADSETLEAKRVEITNAANKRLATAAVEHQGKLIKLQKEADKYLADLKGERSKEAAVAALNKQYENVNDSSVIWLQAEKSAAMAAAEAVGKHEAKLREMERAYEDVAKAAEDMTTADNDLAAKGYILPELSAAAKQLREQAFNSEIELGKFKKTINEDVANQSAIAYNEAFRKRSNEFKNTLAQTLADALVSGANDGGQNLRKILENELKAPFVLLFRMSIDALMGDLSSAVGSATGGTGSGGASSVLSSLGTASTLNTAYKALSGAIEGSIGKSFEKFALSDMGAKFGLSQSSNAGYALPSDLPGTMSEATDAFSTATSEMTSLGKTFTDVGVNMAATFAGQALRKGISGGYSVGGTGEKLMDVAALIASLPGIGGPIASIVTGAVSGLINRTFGRKLKDTGIQGTFAGSEFKGENYQYLKGGWLRSDKTKTSAMDSEAINTFTNTFRSIQASTAVLATNMGLSAQSALDFKKDIKLSLKDLDPAAQSEAITKMFTEVQEEMATAVLDAWGDWSLIAKYGETASEVLTNVSNNLTGFNGMLDLLDLKLIDLTLNGAAAASSVIEAAGGVDALTGIYSSYYENFYSEAERNSKSIETLGEKFAALGVTMPTLTKDVEGFVTNGDAARETFRGLVSAAANAGNIALATELVKLSDAFAEVTPLAEKFLKGLKDETKALNAEFLKAQGNLAGYAAAIRAIETVDMTSVEIATYDYNKQLEKYIELLGQADEARTTASEAEIRLLEAQGNKTAALVKQRELDIKGLSEAQVAAYDYAAAIDRQIESMEKLSAAQDSVAASDIKLLQAQGNSALALAKQRELDIRSMTRAEVAAYDYSNAIDDQISKLEQAADIVSKLGNVSSDLGSYLQQFEKDGSSNFYNTIAEALSGDMEAMDRVTSEADKAIESAKRSSRSTSEFNLKQANVLAKVGQVKAYADTLSKETDTDRLIAAIKGETNTSKSVDALGTRLSANDISVSLNATLETVKKSSIAEAEIAAISNLFSKIKATVTGMSLASQASANGQTILNMFDNMRATVLSVSMSAAPSEVTKVTSAFSNLTAFVTKVQASGLNESSAQAALGSAANVTAAISKLVTSGLTSNSAQIALSALANISAYVNAIDVKPGNTLSAQFQTELAAYSSVSANISTISTTAGIVEARKQVLVQSLSSIAANIKTLSVTSGIVETRKASLDQTFGAISAAITAINIASGLEASTVSKVTDALDSFQATVTSIAIGGADSNIKELLLGNADDLSYGLSLAAAVESGAGTFGLSAEQVKNLLASSDTIKKTLSVASGTDAKLTAAQQEAYANTRTAISKALSVTSGTDGALTEAQKTVLVNASSSLTKALAVKSGADGSLTDAQKTVLANASTSLTKLLAVASGTDSALTAAQQSVLSGVSSSVVKTLAVRSGTDGTLTTAQQQAYANASTTISKAVSVVKGTDATNLTEAQKVLLGILGGASNGQVSVGGSVDYEPSSDLDGLMTNLTTALGKVGIDKMTTELGRLIAAIDQQMAADAAAKKLADAQRAGADIAAKKSVVAAGISQNLDTIAALAPKYGFTVNRGFSNNPWDYIINAAVGSNWAGLSHGGAVTAGNNSNTKGFATALIAAGIGSGTAVKQSTIDSYDTQLEAARKAVIALGGTPQFARGGYTGPGGINEFAGVVHKGEVVWSQSDIANAGGVSNVEAMRKGSMPYASDIPAPGIVYNTTQSTINFDESALLEELQAMREELSNMRYEVRATAVNTGKAAKHLKEFDDRGMKVKNSDTGALETTVV